MSVLFFIFKVDSKLFRVCKISSWGSKNSHYDDSVC